MRTCTRHPSLFFLATAPERRGGRQGSSLYLGRDSGGSGGGGGAPHPLLRPSVGRPPTHSLALPRPTAATKCSLDADYDRDRGRPSNQPRHFSLPSFLSPLPLSLPPSLPHATKAPTPEEGREGGREEKGSFIHELEKRRFTVGKRKEGQKRIMPAARTKGIEQSGVSEGSDTHRAGSPGRSSPSPGLRPPRTERRRPSSLPSSACWTLWRGR